VPEGRWVDRRVVRCHTVRMTTRVRTKRINARLSDDVARKLSYLERRTHMTTTDVVRESIERYYAAVSRDGEPGSAFAGFIGCADGPEDLSESYKRALSESLEKKA
jgi:hypothetical protein